MEARGIQPRTVDRLPGRPTSDTNLADILERVLDKGIVIAGDIQINLLDIELLTVKLRLLIASVDTARQLGIDWWETDPWLTSRDRRAVRGEGRPQLADRQREERELPRRADTRVETGAVEETDERVRVRDR